MATNRPPQIAKPLTLPQSKQPEKPPQLTVTSTDVVKSKNKTTEQQQSAATPSSLSMEMQKPNTANKPSLSVAAPVAEKPPQLPTETVKATSANMASLAPNAPTAMSTPPRKLWSKQSPDFGYEKMEVPTHNVMTVSSL